jgi:hypothetical protein
MNPPVKYLLKSPLYLLLAVIGAAVVVPIAWFLRPYATPLTAIGMLLLGFIAWFVALRTLWELRRDALEFGGFAWSITWSALALGVVGAWWMAAPDHRDGLPMLAFLALLAGIPPVGGSKAPCRRARSGS